MRNLSERGPNADPVTRMFMVYRCSNNSRQSHLVALGLLLGIIRRLIDLSLALRSGIEHDALPSVMLGKSGVLQSTS